MVFGVILIVGENAIIEYRWVDDSVIDLHHTEVPPTYRGKGIAQLLAKVNFSMHFTLTVLSVILNSIIDLLHLRTINNLHTQTTKYVECQNGYLLCKKTLVHTSSM